MMIKYFKITILIILIFKFSNLLSYESKIIVKVDNQVITNYDLKNKILTTLVLTNEEINQENINKTKPIVLKSLIDLKIKENEIKKYKINATLIEIQNNLNLLANNDLESFKNKFLSNNLNYQIYKKDLETEIKWRKLIYILYKKKVIIDESEINLQLQKILNQKNKTNKEYKISELMISFSDEQDKQKKIQEVNDEINRIGFEKVLLKYNESLNKSNLGDLGWVNSQSLSKNILSEIKNLKINEISKPIIIGNNLLFLKIKNIRHNKKAFKDEDIKDIREQILNSKENQRFTLYSNSHLSKLKNLTNIEYK